MMMYIRLIVKDDIYKFKYSNKLPINTLLICPYMTDWRVEVVNGIITHVYLKHSIRYANEESYYETSRCYYGKLPRFYSSNSLNILSRV